MRLIGRIVKWGALLFLGVLAVGVIYGQVGRIADNRLAPPASEMFTVRGHHVHVVRTGAGPRTFVLDAGLGGWSLFWGPIQPLLSRYGQVYSFDRPGTGWSDPTAAGHDGIAAAEELDAIVQAAHIPTPFAYVGHSLGATFAQI